MEIGCRGCMYVGWRAVGDEGAGRAVLNAVAGPINIPLPV